MQAIWFQFRLSLHHCYWLWWSRYGEDHRMAILALVPVILFAYIVPGIGTNVLKLWEFNTRFRIGRFRPQHGFVFGTATSLLALACLPYPAADPGPLEWARAAVVIGSVLGFWNWLYDQHAIRSGFLVVYNRAFAEQRGPEVGSSVMLLRRFCAHLQSPRRGPPGLGHG